MLPTTNSIALVGACNVRDLGGHVTGDGRRVRSGLLLRGDSPHQLTAADLLLIGGMGLRTVIDLRSAEEIAVLGPEPLLALGVETLHEPLKHAPGSTQVLRLGNGDSAQLPSLAELYEGFLEHSGPELARIVIVAAEPARRPLLFHCLAGKDRTGIVAAILLDLLGVPDETIAADYEATAAALPRLRELTRNDRDRLGLNDFVSINPQLLGAQAATMLAFLKSIRARFESSERYLAGFGVAPQVIEAFRADLLIGADLD